jgi:uncharacterized membrane-anchored protein
MPLVIAVAAAACYAVTAVVWLIWYAVTAVVWARDVARIRDRDDRLREERERARGYCDP